MERAMIVCDLGHLKLYEVQKTPSGTYRLELLKEIDIPEAHERLGEMITDSAGLFGMGSERGSTKGYGEKHTIEEEIQKKIIKTLAQEINSFYLAHRPKRLYLSAPQRVHSKLLDRLRPEVTGSIKKSIKADLTKHSKEDLVEKFFST